MKATNFQRIGSQSNAHVGKAFEADARTFFAAEGINLSPDHSVRVGIHTAKKDHKFDLGTDKPPKPTLVECKSHTWTKTGNVPSAKLTVWNEAMYYFHAAPDEYQKILFVLKHRHKRQQLTLAAYYLDKFAHLIPDKVEIWEFDPLLKNAERIH